MIDQKLIESVQGSHPAVNMSFDTLYSNLQQEIALGNVYHQFDVTGNLEIFSYSDQCSFDKNWTLYSMLARGLILAPNEKIVVALAYPKFFNYGEYDSYQIPNEPFEVLEKIDGSLGIVFYYNNQWNVATRGSFQSEQACWGNEYLKTLKTEKLNKNVTYLVEIIYKKNRIVINYNYEGMVLHGAYELNTGFEWSQNFLDDAAKQVGFRRPKVYDYNSIDQLIEICEKMSSDQEGFVIKFRSGYRIKIKGAEYCRIHRLISYCTPCTIWDSMWRKDSMDDIYKQLPEEFRTDFNSIVSIYNKKIEDVFFNFNIVFEGLKNLSNKEIGLKMKDKSFLIPSYLIDMVFEHRKRDVKESFENAKSFLRKSIFDSFYPKANFLSGYTPTTSMNRFKQEQG